MGKTKPGDGGWYLGDTVKYADLLEASERVFELVEDDDVDPRELMKAQEEFQALLEKKRSGEKTD